MPDQLFNIGGVDPQAKRLVELYKQAQATRMPYEADWRRVAELGLPRDYGGWVTLPGPGATTGAARQARLAQFDSTLARSISKFGAILERAVTPMAQIYHVMGPTDRSMLKVRAVREYYDTYNDLLFSHRYHPLARFQSAQGQLYRSFGAYGNACKMVTWRERPPNDNRTMRRGRGRGGLLYRSVPFSKLYWLVDHDEQISTWFRRIDWTSRQAVEALGESCPKKVREDFDKASTSDRGKTWEFFQVVMPAEQYEENAFDFRRFPLTSLYVFAEEPMIVKQPAGYYSQPFSTPRMYPDDGSPYGYGSGQQVLSNVGSANATVKTMLKVGQKIADPPLLTRDDGALSQVDITPGALNPGGLDSQGREMVKPLIAGNLQVAEKLHASMQDDIKDAFFVTLFEMLKDRPQMTATEVMHYAIENASMLSPIMGLLQADDQGPQIEREIDLLEKNGMAPEKPGEVLENPEYDITYTSPLAKAARGEGIKGFMQLSTMAMEYAKGTGDNRPLKQLNFAGAMPEIADLMAVPARWMNTPEEAAAETAKETQQQQTQTLVDLAPAAASLARTNSSNANKAPAV